MHHEQAEDDLDRALTVLRAEPASPRHLHAVRQLLLDRGMAALGTERMTVRSLAEVIEIAGTAQASPERRMFAVLLVHALGVDGVVRVGAARAGLDRIICAFVEDALPTPLRRSGYPFGASTYDKIGFLTRLGGLIDHHLNPPEPTFPTWLSGLDADGKG